MSFFAASALVNAITSIVLGFLVFSRKPSDRTHLLFSLFAFSVAGWSLAYFFWQIADSESVALMWIRIQMAAMIFIPFFYFHFVSLFLGIAEKKKLITAAAYIFGTLFLLVANFTTLFIADVAPLRGFKFWPVPGPFFFPFLVIWGFYILYATFHLLQYFWRSTGIRRHQIQYIIVGMVIGYVGGITNFFLWFDTTIPTIGNTLVSFYVIMVSYAILKHHLFHLKVIATELLVFALWVFLFMQTLLATTPEEQITNGGILAAMMLVGALLIQSVLVEVRAREESDLLARDLQIANKTLQEIDKRKTESISVASHQLRSPVAAIKGYASLVLEGSFGSVTPSVKSAVQRIFDASNDMAASVQDFLDVSRLEEGDVRFRMRPESLTLLVEEAAADMESFSRAKDLSVEHHVPAEDIVANVDREKVKQVLSNLLDNSIKYTPRGGVVTITLRADKNRGKACIDITDSGVGMSKDTQQHLFERFTRAENAMRANVYGTGLGLYIAKKLVEGHGGKIAATSAGEGKGSTFSIEFPLAR